MRSVFLIFQTTLFGPSNKNFQQFVFKVSHTIQFSKPGYFSSDNQKKACHDSLVIFELRFNTVGQLVWEINRHTTQLFITSYLFFKEEKKLQNCVDVLAEN